MAASYVNTVPGGQIGTGNAQVFGANPLATQFANQLGDLRKRQEFEAQKTAKAWKDNQLAASKGRLWASDMAGLEKDFIDRGIKLKQGGIDPYGTSQEALDYQRDQRYVEAQQGFREAKERDYTAALAKISDKTDPKSIKALNDYFLNTKLVDAFAGNQAIPQLKDRFDAAGAIKGLRAPTMESKRTAEGITKEITEVNTPEAENMVLGALRNTIGGMDYINSELTSGFTVPDVKGFDKTYQGNADSLKAEIAGNPPLQKQLAEQGIAPDSQLMQEYISDQAYKRTEAKKKFDSELQALVAMTATGVKTENLETPYRDPNEMTAAQKDASTRGWANLNRLKAKDAADASGEQQDPPSDLTFSYGVTDPKTGVRPSFTGLGTVKLNSTKMNMHGEKVIDTTTGRPTKTANASSEFDLVELTHAPILLKSTTITKPDGTKEILEAGSVVQDSYAEANPKSVEYKKVGVVQKDRGKSDPLTYYIDADLIPTNTMSKISRGLYDKFISDKSYERGVGTTRPASSGKMSNADFAKYLKSRNL